MIGFFKRIMEATEVQRVRRRARQDVSPRSTLDLCRLLQRQGRVKSARDVARDGLARFPHSAELRAILHSTWQRSTKKEVEELEARLSADPSVANFQALIEHLRQYDLLDRASEIANQMVEAHPGSPEAALLAGRLFVERFQKDLVAEDGACGIANLQRASELSTRLFEAPFELAKTYYHIGAVSKALFWLYKALDIQPDDSEANRLYRILTRLPLEKQEESELLREAEENDEGRFRYEPARAAVQGPAASGGLVTSVERFSSLAGVRRVVLWTPNVEVVAQDGRRQASEREEIVRLLALAKGFRKSASLSSKRMGIGAFSEAEMTWDGGVLLAFAAGRSILLVESQALHRVATISAEARNFLAGAVQSTNSEPAHA